MTTLDIDALRTALFLCTAIGVLCAVYGLLGRRP